MDGDHRELGARLGAGGSAEVFAFGEGAVLKLFRVEYAFAADREAERTRSVHAAGVPVPAVLDVIDWDGRRGIVMERVRAQTLLDDLIAGTRRPGEVGRLTADAQLSYHGRTADLPRLHEVGGGGDLPRGDSIAHLDFHAGNVMVTAEAFVLLDWVNAHLAPPAADVARSVMTIRYQGLGLLGAGSLDEERTVRQRILDRYLERYDGTARLPDDLAGWLGRTASRLLRAEPSNPDRATLEVLVARGQALTLPTPPGGWRCR
jgi:aminoglycoside phosphotransferase (APT) family kinase protein